MYEPDELTGRDHELLKSIDGVLSGSESRGEVDQSQISFCELLASAVPLPDSGFERRLKGRLETHWRKRYAAHHKGSLMERFVAWFQPLWPARVEPQKISHSKGRLAMKWSFVLFILVALAIALMAVTRVPPVKAAVMDAVLKLVLGANTVAVQIDPLTKPEPGSLPDDMWVIRTEIGNFGGNVLPGVDPVVRSVRSLEEARALVDYFLKAPAELPEGYSLREIKLAPMSGVTWALLFYSGPGHEIIIAEMPGGPQPSSDPNTVTAIKTGILTDGTLENVDFDGQSAAWIEGHTLLWESNGVSYEVGGLDLDLEQAMRIARSLQ